MIKWLIPVAASAVLMGCNSDSGGSGSGELNVTLKSPTFAIDAESRSAVDTAVSDAALSTSASEYADINLSRSSSRSLTESGLSARISESGSLACDSGSFSYSINGDGVNDDGSFSTNGDVSISLTANNCRSDYGNGWYDLENGEASISLNWSGYNGYDTFDSLTAMVLFDDFSYEEYDDIGLINYEEIDGGVKASISGNESSVEIALSTSSSDLNNQIITIETTTPLKQRLSDYYPYQGVVRVNGGNGTSVVYTVVSEGVEVSLNGGQPELVTWSEIEQL